jgi:cyclophilin family peptidyl-prolyl cis-trans isomerase
MKLPEKISSPLRACQRLGLALYLGLILCSEPKAQAQSQDPIVILETTKGPIVIRVYAGMAPMSARNFLDLVGRGYYNGKVFHRVETWCIQGGSTPGNPNSNYVDPNTGQPRFVPLEINHNLHHSQAGVVAMARSNNPNSASCQFYILKKPMPQLDGQYAVFAGVVDGQQTIYRIGVGDQIISGRILSGGSKGGSTATRRRPLPSSSASSSSTSRPEPAGESGF